MTRHIAALVFVTSIVCFAGCGRKNGESLTIAEIVARNTEAMGGRAAIEAIRSVQFDLHIKDPTFEVDGTYYATRPGKMRIDVKADGKHVFSEAFDGTNGWEWDGQQQKPASEKGAAALRHGVELPGHLFGLHELKARGHKIESLTHEQIGDINYYVVKLILKDGYPVWLYIDPNNWLVTRRRDVRPLHVDVDPTPTTIEQVSSDFREVGGVKFPFANTETDINTGKVLETSTIKEVRINPTLAPALFEKL